MVRWPHHRDADHEQVARREREARAGSVRFVAYIAAAVALLYIVTNPLYFTAEAVARFNVGAVALICLMVAFGQFTLSRWYLDYPLLDFVWFVLIAAAATYLGFILGLQSHLTGWSLVASITGNGVMVLCFSCFLIVGSFRTYALVAAIHGIVFALLIVWVDARIFEKIIAASVYFPVSAALLYGNLVINRSSRNVYALNKALTLEKQATEGLLFNIMPRDVAERIRGGERVADSFSDASVIFVDLVGSSHLARTLTPGHFVDLLNEVFSIADRCAKLARVEKVKTIGDAYLAVAGAALRTERSAAVSFARTVITGVSQFARDADLPLQVRIGIHTGPVIGGVIGQTRMTYDYWGDTMNIAARVQAVAEPGGFSVTEPTFHATKGIQQYAAPRLLNLKGIGETKVYDAILG